MNKTTIILGGSASINNELTQKYKFVIVPFKLEWAEESSLSGDNIFAKMRASEEKGIPSAPKTSQPSIGAFKKAFEDAALNNGNAIYIAISSKISGAYNSALQGKKMLPEDDQKRIHIIDSENADAAETLLAIMAAEMAEKGMDIEEIIRETESSIKKTYLFGMLGNPKWLEVGGRIGHAAATMLFQMQKLGMRPVVHVREGIVKPANLKINSKDTAEALFKHFENIADKSKKYRVGISHADNIAEAEELKRIFEAKCSEGVKVEFVNMAGIIIGSHVGPGTVICSIIEE